MSNCTGFGTASVLLMFNDINHFVMKSLCFILIQLPFQFISQTQFKLITLAGRQVLKKIHIFLYFLVIIGHNCPTNVSHNSLVEKILVLFHYYE